jgi:tetratricopeptide (TPR) repeat protein
VSSYDIFRLRKQGCVAEALKMAREQYSLNASDVWFLRAYAWVLYDHAKRVIDRYEAGELSPAGLSKQLTPWMREFARIAAPLRGDSAFSGMLRLAGKACKDWSAFLGFACWAGTAHFSDSDKKPFVNEQGRKVDSLQKRFIRAICRQTSICAADPQANPEWVEWGTGVLQQALKADPNDQWLNYYQSKVHLAQGEPGPAIKRLMPVFRRKPRAAWLWAQLGDILTTTRPPEDALTCYAYATQVAREEQEVANVRIQLAHRLALAGRFSEAAHQASLARRYREERRFRLPQELQQLLASDWFQREVANGTLQQLPKVDGAARALLEELSREHLTYSRGVIDHVNTEKSLSYVAFGIASGLVMRHSKFPGIADLPPGTVVEVGRAEPEGPALGWRLSETRTIAGLCESFSGNLERHEGKSFAFVRSPGADIFVPPGLAKAFAVGQTHPVTCLAIRRTNKKGKTGWRAVKFFTEPGAESLSA